MLTGLDVQVMRLMLTCIGNRDAMNRQHALDVRIKGYFSNAREICLQLRTIQAMRGALQQQCTFSWVAGSGLNAILIPQRGIVAENRGETHGVGRTSSGST